MNPSSYRDKYLETLDELDRTEQRSKTQIDLLRKTLLSVSTAAKGLDKNLDGELIALREKFRGAGGQQVVDQMERIQQAVMDFEFSRTTESKLSFNNLNKISSLLLELDIPSETQRKILAFKNELKAKLDSYRNYPSIIADLSQLQALVFRETSKPATGFFARLRGKKQFTNTPSQMHTPVKPEALEKPEKTKLPPDKDQASKVDLPPVKNVLSSPEAEDDYQNVAVRIEVTLDDLISHIEPNDIVRHKVDIVKARIKRGMDWFALAITLEDIRDILMQRYLSADKEFSDYLQRIDSELLSIGEALGLAVEQGNKQNDAATMLSSAVSEQVSHIQTSVQSSKDLAQLKQTVADHLNVIQTALVSYHRSEEEKQSLASQLEQLMGRVQTVENEAKQTKQQLEEQRYRATHDSLTELPNREAFTERAYHEMQRFKRYQRPLTFAVCDIDYFKRINDTYGHQAGDKVLKIIAKIMAKRLREVDFIARFGGEEFVLIMPETGTEQALSVLDKIRLAVADTPFRFKEQPVHISVSFGLAQFLTDDDKVETVFERADKALYQAKEEGRNRCIIAN